MDTLKAEQLTGSKWRVLAIPFGGPFKGGKDLDGEFFDAKTDIKPHWFKARPVIVHHGQDSTAKDEDYGEQELDAAPASDGWWSDVWLNRSARYWAQVDALLRAGKMYGSSGTIGHLVRKAANGHIEVWPHVEQTLTLTPANPYARITASKALSGFNLAGIELSDTVKSLLEELDRPATADLPSDLPAPGELAAAPQVTLARAAMTRR
jgi:hypothetical protein